MSDVFAVTVPTENVNDEVATIVEWNKESGSAVSKGDVIVTLETMKATFELEAEEDGYLFYEIEEGLEVRIGSEIAYICKENIKPEMRANIFEASMSKRDDVNIHISAKAEKLMKEYGLRSEDFIGLEKVKLADVENMIAEKSLEKRAASGIGRNKQNLPSHEIVKISPAKKYEIQQLKQSHERVVPSSVSVMIDIKKVEEKIKKKSASDGVPSTVFELIIFEVSRLLKKYNLFNGFYSNGNCIVYNVINIGFAVNIGKGLKVPVINNAEKLSLKEISNSVKDFSLKYIREELTLADLSGGTFTVTDLSSKGVTDFYPIINNMQSAILGVCAVMPGTNSFKVILTFDHNMADGIVAADMLNELSTLLQVYNNAV